LFEAPKVPYLRRSPHSIFMGTVRVQEAVILLDGLSNALRLFPRRLNFLADVRQVLGPYLAVYLYQTEIGQKTKSAS
jgi:hypothetical protein